MSSTSNQQSTITRTNRNNRTLINTINCLNFYPLLYWRALCTFSVQSHFSSYTIEILNVNTKVKSLIMMLYNWLISQIQTDIFSNTQTFPFNIAYLWRVWQVKTQLLLSNFLIALNLLAFHQILFHLTIFQHRLSSCDNIPSHTVLSLMTFHCRLCHYMTTFHQTVTK